MSKSKMQHQLKAEAIAVGSVIAMMRAMEKLLVVEPEMCLHGAFEVGQRRADSNPLSFSLSQLQNCRVIGRCTIKVGSTVIPQVD